MNLLFEIAVYRVSGEEWREFINQEVARGMDAYYRSAPPMAPDVARKSMEHRRAQLWNLVSGGLPYTYNEVVGWIQVHDDGDAIKAYGHRVPLKRIRRGFARSYVYIDKLFELRFFEETSAEIVAEIRGAILSLTREGEPFARRVVDLKAFDVVAPLIDWREFLALDL